MLSRALLLTVLFTALPTLAKPPRLTLFISVDALGSDVLLRNQSRLKGGLGQLVSSGAFFPTAQYEYAECVTAPSRPSTESSPTAFGIETPKPWSGRSPILRFRSWKRRFETRTTHPPET